MFDGKAFGEQMVDVVKAAIDKATSPLLADIKALRDEVAELRAREPAKGLDGQDADMGALKAHLDSLVRGIPAPHVPTIEDLIIAIDERVGKAIAAIPEPTIAIQEKALSEDAIKAIISDGIAAAAAQLPKPKDGDPGKSIAPDDVRDMLAEMVQREVSNIPKPKDGISIAGSFIDQSGNWVLTLSNGDVKDMGPVKGRDGVSVDPEQVREMVQKAVDEIPRPKDGRDGFSLDDFDASLMADGRTIELKFERGDYRYTFELCFPVMIYRGIYQDGKEYEEGDTATFAGSLWYCNGGDLTGPYKGATKEKPGEGSKYWRLAAKRGRDGKDFKGSEPKAIGSVKI